MPRTNTGGASSAGGSASSMGCATSWRPAKGARSLAASCASRKYARTPRGSAWPMRSESRSHEKARHWDRPRRGGERRRPSGGGTVGGERRARDNPTRDPIRAVPHPVEPDGEYRAGQPGGVQARLRRPAGLAQPRVVGPSPNRRPSVVRWHRGNRRSPTGDLPDGDERDPGRAALGERELPRSLAAQPAVPHRSLVQGEGRFAPTAVEAGAGDARGAAEADADAEQVGERRRPQDQAPPQRDRGREPEP